MCGSDRQDGPLGRQRKTAVGSGDVALGTRPVVAFVGCGSGKPVVRTAKPKTPEPVARSAAGCPSGWESRVNSKGQTICSASVEVHP